MISSLFGRIVVLCALMSFSAAFAQVKSNHAPTMNGDQLFHGVKNQVMRFTLAGASDTDQDELSYELIESQNFGELKNCLQGTNNLKCEFVPKPDFRGVASFTYKANDGVVDSQNNSKVVLRYDLNNHMPTVGIEREFSGTTNKTLTFTLPEGRDSDNDNIFYQLVSHNGAGTISGCFQNSESRICEYHPVNGHNEAVTILYKVFDGIAASEENGQIVLRLGAVNHAPTMNGDQTFTTTKFTLAGASDADGDIVTYSLVSPTSLPALKGCLNGTSKLNCEYIPEQNERGEVVFTYRANDTKENSKNIATVKLRLGENTNTSPLARMNCEQKSRRLTCHSTSSDSDGTISKTEWTLNGETIIGANFTRLLPTDGSYKVSLRVWDNEEAEATLERSFLLFNTLPQINLSCLTNGSNINCDAGLSYDPDGQIEKYEWDFADGAIGNGVNVAHTYLAPGSYLVRVKAIDDMGDSSFATYQVQIFPNQVPEVKFTCTTKSRTISCSSQSTDSDGAIIKEEWLVDNKSYEGSTLSHKVGQDGSYVIKLTAWDNAGAFISKEETLLIQNALPQAMISCQQASERAFYCLAQNALDPDGSISSFEWYADDQKVAETQSATISFTTSGQHFIKLKVTDDVGAFINISYPVSLEENEEPWANLQYQASKGSPEVVFSVMKYDAEKELQSAVIDFGDGQTVELNKDTWMEQVTHVYESVGQYNVKITLEDSVENVSENITTVFAGNSSFVWPYLEADAFQVAPLTLGAFTYFSYSPFYDVVEFSVDWGDGQRTTDSIPQFYRHKYQAPGEYTVTFSMKDASGRTNQKTEKYSVDSSSVEASYPHPFPVYFKEGGFNSVFRFTSFSTSTSGLLTNALFELGDGNTQNFDLSAGNQLVPSFYHVYAPGNYNTKLTVTDANGNSNDQEANISVFASDVYTARIRCSNIGYDVTCTVKAYSPNGTLQGANVSWGDGVTESLSDVSGTFYKMKITHHFESGGAKSIQLEIFDSVNSSRTDKRTVNLPATIVNPVADFNCNTQGKKVRCGSSSATNNGELVELIWEFDDGQKAYGPFIEHDFAQDGNHVVKLVVKDSLGLVAEVIKEIAILANKPPVAFPSCVVTAMTVSCESSLSYDEDGFIVEQKWDMGDGNIISGPSINHQYLQPGAFQIRLTVKDNLGLESFKDIGILIGQNFPPVIDSFACQAQDRLVNCIYSAHDPDGQIEELSIDWNDGSLGSNLAHTYYNYGQYKIRLGVRDNTSLWTYLEADVELVKPNISPLAKAICYKTTPLAVHCTGILSEDLDGQIISYAWDMGDGTTNTSSEFDYTYTQNGIYKISLKVKDNQEAEGEDSTFISFLTSDEPLQAIAECYYTNTLTLSCSCEETRGKSAISRCLWESEGVKKEGRSVDFVYGESGSKWVSLRVIDNEGTISDSKDLKLVFNEPPVDLDVRCEINGNLLTCSAGVVGDPAAADNSNYSWEIWGETMLVGKSITHSLSRFGEFTIVLSANTLDRVYSQKKIKVFAPPTYVLPEALFKEDVQLDRLVHFDATDATSLNRKIAEYKWSFSDNADVVITDSPKTEYTFTSLGLHKVSLEVRDAMGATSSIEKEIRVYDPQVPMPGVENDLTLTGIDSDNDGVRDDVQRWIASVAQNDKQIEYLKKLARLYQDVLVQEMNFDEYEALRPEMELRASCLAQADIDSSLALERKIVFYTFKSKNRYDFRKNIFKDVPNQFSFKEVASVKEGEMNCE